MSWDSLNNISSTEDMSNSSNRWNTRPSQTSLSNRNPINEEVPEDVASLISSLGAANSNVFGQAHSVLGSFSPNTRQAAGSVQNAHNANVGTLDEAVISDSGSDLFNGNNLKDALSVISAPVAIDSTKHIGSMTQGAGAGYDHHRFATSIFGGAASVAGVGVSNFNGSALGGSNFMEKFSSIAEKTRELERSFGKLSMTSPSGQQAGRVSQAAAHQQNQQNQQKQQRSHVSSTVGSARASFSSSFREPKQPSFSEKLDTYMQQSNATSPMQSRHMSFSSEANLNSEQASSVIEDVESQHRQHNASGIWNPAAAVAFYPGQGQQKSGVSQFDGMVMPSPAFMVPPPGVNYMQMPMSPFSAPMPLFGDPRSGFASKPDQADDKGTIMKNKASSSSDQQHSKGSFNSNGKNDSNGGTSSTSESDTLDNEAQDKDLSPRPGFFPPGIARPISPYMVSPFSPYRPQEGAFTNLAGSPSGSSPAPGMQFSPIGTPTMLPSEIIKGTSPIGPGVRDGMMRPSSPGARISPGNYAHGGRRSGRAGKTKKRIFRSPLLEEFRSNKNGKEYKLKDILGHAYEFSKDQHGSRFIQQQLADASAEDKEMIFNEIRNYSIDLMTDVFGNYVIQKYFEYGNETQIKILFESMKGNFNFLSMQMYGCRVVQKCMDSVSLDDRLQVVDELKPNILNLVKDQNGNHVIQKVIESIPTSRTPFILESLKHQIYHLSTHPYGCRVIQRLLEYSDEEDRAYILGELKGFIYYLVQDQFGNYVIQHIIEHGSEQYTEQILQIVIDNLVNLSKHKFASNAVEKCIVHQSAENRRRVYDALLARNENKDSPLDENSSLSIMMKDPFANYVVQKMVELVDGPERALLVYKIRQYLDLITKTNSSSKHLASIDKLIALTEKFGD
ncbi:DEBR0S5_01354g1_1 [Brettanomyces bruxellensis]|uniref:Pumilio homology domain family member 3 n=1 Tax=Dekkera bruxellensis TaxID=5007 RepID=A0A7D9D070_DEKBR|nr:DEBR0S5_01354g1_1 [Brettanomyces bruxellensis]